MTQQCNPWRAIVATRIQFPAPSAGLHKPPISINGDKFCIHVCAICPMTRSSLQFVSPLPALRYKFPVQLSPLRRVFAIRQLRPAHIVRASIVCEREGGLEGEAEWVIVDVSVQALPAEAHLHAINLERDGRDLLRYVMKNEPVELSIVLCSDEEIKSLNDDWRDKPRPTDVLSFPQNDEVVLGDLVISLETACRQANEHNLTPRDELRVLLVHGVLHLIGYDHEKSENHHRLMADAEEKILDILHWKGSGLASR